MTAQETTESRPSSLASRAPQPIERSLVFISHANPEDNEFTAWLASRLACHGYRVWSDVTRLLGGETFWDDIEDAIRLHAAKTVVVLSRVAQAKKGVQDEVHLAISVERDPSLLLKDFVIPIRIDDLPFNQVKANLARKNIIDCRENWAVGLQRLLEVLVRDGVPRVDHPSTTMAGACLMYLGEAKQLIAEPEPLVSNWLEISETPKSLYFHRTPLKDTQVRGQFETFPFPVYPHSGLVVTFASEEEVNDGLPRFQKAMRDKTVALDALLSGKPHSMPNLKWQDGSNIVQALLRSAWDKAMHSNGLLRYELANGRVAWFPAHGRTEGNWVHYTDVLDKRRRKQLVGYSAKRSVYWHYAVEAVPLVFNSRIALRPHVVFTEDGVKPIEAPAKMQKLRRGFCRSWWNARWRDLLLAYTTSIADSSDVIELAVGDGQVFEIRSRPVVLVAPFSLAGEDVPEAEETEALLDELDQGDIGYGETLADGVDDETVPCADDSSDIEDTSS